MPNFQPNEKKEADNSLSSFSPNLVRSDIKSPRFRESFVGAPLWIDDWVVTETELRTELIEEDRCGFTRGGQTGLFDDMGDLGVEVVGEDGE